MSKNKIKGLLCQDRTPVAIEIEGGLITDIAPLKKLPRHFPDLYVSPGLIDNQVNGFAGVTFSLGSDELTVEGVEKVTKALWKYGVTTYLPTLTTNSHALFLQHLSILKKAVEKEELLGSIAGFHLEGPYINPEDGYRGAHPKEFVRLPNWCEFMEYYKASGHHILQVTLAPEMDGAMDFISRCKQLGVVVALGHHNASPDEVTAAIDRGAGIATHLGNGAANMIHRHHNPFWSQLADDRLSISIICDGFHLLPEEIKVFQRVKGVDKTILTSDATSYAGLPPGFYRSAEGHTIEISPAGKLWNHDQQGLYGSALSINKGLEHLIKVTGCSLAEGIQMASTNPARLYKLHDRGLLAPGKRADLVLFSFENFQITIWETWVNGIQVYNRSI